ncbi:MAG TPA: endonuclease III domain-containing protein [Patescibacteria group bacterium]|nr:endonuclease III domain-containing protein [Patescibacteria group bacterium]
MPIRKGTPLVAWYAALRAGYGAQSWWPARTRFEVVLGAILTQGVAWSNVEQALRALRRAGLWSPDAVRRASRARVARLIRPAGYFNQKALAIKGFVRFLHVRHGGRLDRMFRTPTPELRERLLELRGIGPETADAILLYAGGRRSFVIDAYTRRVLFRHRAIRGSEGYEELRLGFEAALPRRAPLYNEYHALIVRLGKERCRRSRPLCSGCPLEPWLSSGGPRK